MPIHLRVFAKAANIESAEAIADKLLRTLEEFHPRVVQSPRKYWKLEGHFEFACSLSPVTPERMALDTIIQLAENGWELLGSKQEPEAIWNKKPDSTFICPEVAWAHLELLSSRPNP